MDLVYTNCLKMLPLLLVSLLSTHIEGNVFYSDVANELDSNSTQFHVEYVLLDQENPCSRTCTRGAPPMICRYHFTIEYYSSMSKACYNCPFNSTDCFLPDCIPTDGRVRPIVTVNRKIPGPAIEVCKDDVIVVDVQNHLPTEATTIHWHGQHQKNYPYMDGVPYVTQCPILPHETFRYTFRASQAGTHFWHSHIGMQRADGVYGALIIREPEEDDPVSQFCDYDLSDHVFIITDWEPLSGWEKFLIHHHGSGDNKPSAVLVNGFGQFDGLKNADNETVYVPAPRFRVQRGYRYRFRIINAGFLNCPIEVSIDNHSLTVISSDGHSIRPVEATSLVTYAGERFDFVVNADQPPSLYWIRFKGLMDCDERFTRAHVAAVLEYEESNATRDDYPDGELTYENAHRNGLQVNALNRGVESNISFLSMPQLESLQGWDESLKMVPDYQFYIAYDFYKIDNENFHRAPYYPFKNFADDPNKQALTPQFNHISMEMPSIPLLPQRYELADNMFCNNDTIQRKNCEEVHCSCHHGIKVPLGSVVEMVFIDEGFAYDANHPIHLHGYSFRVVAMERVGVNATVEQIKAREKAGLIQRNLLNPPLKDTVTVPDGGYTIVRFLAKNPGYWILHCHIEFHAEVGMAMIVQVGEKDEMLPVPPKFPRCGNYEPDIIVPNIVPVDNLRAKSSSQTLSANIVLVLVFSIIMHLNIITRLI